jgi:DNA-binding NarL/FixJ family response regulator
VKAGVLLEPLTPREQEVCSFLLLGWDAPRIAKELNISRRTVEAHRAKVYEKWDVHNAAQLIRAIYKLGNRRGAYEDAFEPPWRR